jgi:hypothetical protein
MDHTGTVEANGERKVNRTVSGLTRDPRLDRGAINSEVRPPIAASSPARVKPGQ